MAVTGAFNPVQELRGLALPATRGARGFFDSKNQFDVAWGDLIMAVFVPRGSRPMRRSFGSALYDLLFNPMDIEDELIEVAIKDTAAQFCPHITIRRVTLLNVDRGHVEVGIVFSLTSDLAAETDRSVVVRKTHINLAGAA